MQKMKITLNKKIYNVFTKISSLIPLPIAHLIFSASNKQIYEKTFVTRKYIFALERLNTTIGHLSPGLNES